VFDICLLSRHALLTQWCIAAGQDEGGLLYFDEAGVYINGTNLYSAYLYNNKLKCGVPNVPCASLAPSVKGGSLSNLQQCPRSAAQ
jgi:hypothetical protein